MKYSPVDLAQKKGWTQRKLNLVSSDSKITAILASIFFHLVIYLVLHMKLLLYQATQST